MIVHDVLMQNMERENRLMEESRDLKNELQAEGIKLENATAEQKENEEILMGLQKEVQEVKKQIDDVEEVCQVLKNEQTVLDQEKNQLEHDLEERERNERANIEPQIIKREESIKQLIQEIA